MPDLPTSQDLFRIARDEVLVGNSNLARAVVERTGTDTNALVAAGVGIGDAVVGQLGKAVADLYLASARKAGLDRLIFDRYRYARKPAAPAVGQVQFTTSGAAAATFAIPIGTTLSTVDGVAFATTTAVSFAIGTLGPYSANVQSVNGGASQQAIAGSITTITGSISGAPANLHVTNASATAGASDEESDDDFRIRGQLAYTTQFRGTLNALVAGALTVPGVTKAVAFEYLDSTLEPARAVEVVVTDTFTEQLINSATSPASRCRSRPAAICGCKTWHAATKASCSHWPIRRNVGSAAITRSPARSATARSRSSFLPRRRAFRCRSARCS